VLSGRVQLDLRKVEPDRARSRLSCLATLPDGVRVEILVGALAANMPACRVLADEAVRLDIDIVGESRAVQFWLEFCREPDTLASPWQT
jgi:hypothetical protein